MLLFFDSSSLSLLFLFLLLLSPDVRSPTNFVPLAGYSFQPGGIRTRIAVALARGFSSSNLISPPIHISPLRFFVRTVRMNNKIMPTSTAAWSRCDIGTFSTMIHPEFHPSNMRGNCAVRRQIFLAIGTRSITKDGRAGNTVNEHVSSNSASFVTQHTSSRSRVNSSKCSNDWKIYFGRKRFQALDNF